MADIFDDMAMDTDKGQKVKSNEITGDRFQFHSLPKEFQDWHNNYYILEKQGEIDKNSVSKAMLNGYMWQTITDGTLYGMAITMATVSAVIKFKLAPSIAGFLFTSIFFVPFIFFVAYHFIFYAMIRAQVIGTVTKASANVTSYTFYTTFFGVYLSLMSAFIFLIAIGKDLLILMFSLIKKVHGDTEPTSAIQQNFENALIWFHNFLVDIFANNGPFYDTIYFHTFITTAFAVLVIYLFEYKFYNNHSEDIQKELKKTKNEQGYPIEGAQRIMKEWREQNGI